MDRKLLENVQRADIRIRAEAKANQELGLPSTPEWMWNYDQCFVVHDADDEDRSAYDSVKAASRLEIRERWFEIYSRTAESLSGSVFEKITEDYSVVKYRGKEYMLRGANRIVVKLCDENEGQPVTMTMIKAECARAGQKLAPNSFKINSIFDGPSRELYKSLIVPDGPGSYRIEKNA